jgi:hypothetical protein
LLLRLLPQFLCRRFGSLGWLLVAGRLSCSLKKLKRMSASYRMIIGRFDLLRSSWCVAPARRAAIVRQSLEAEVWMSTKRILVLGGVR